MKIVLLVIFALLQQQLAAAAAAERLELLGDLPVALYYRPTTHDWGIANKSRDTDRKLQAVIKRSVQEFLGKIAGCTECHILFIPGPDYSDTNIPFENCAIAFRDLCSAVTGFFGRITTLNSQAGSAPSAPPAALKFSRQTLPEEALPFAPAAAIYDMPQAFDSLNSFQNHARSFSILEVVYQSLNRFLELLERQGISYGNACYDLTDAGSFTTGTITEDNIRGLMRKFVAARTHKEKFLHALRRVYRGYNLGVDNCVVVADPFLEHTNPLLAAIATMTELPAVHHAIDEYIKFPGMSPEQFKDTFLECARWNATHQVCYEFVSLLADLHDRYRALGGILVKQVESDGEEEAAAPAASSRARVLPPKKGKQFSATAAQAQMETALGDLLADEAAEKMKKRIARLLADETKARQQLQTAHSKFLDDLKQQRAADLKATQNKQRINQKKLARKLSQKPETPAPDASGLVAESAAPSALTEMAQPAAATGNVAILAPPSLVDALLLHNDGEPLESPRVPAEAAQPAAATGNAAMLAPPSLVDALLLHNDGEPLESPRVPAAAAQPAAATAITRLYVRNPYDLQNVIKSLPVPAAVR